MLGIGRKRRQEVVDETRLRLQEDIRRARKERDIAQSLFENVVEFDRIDHAIYTLEAAEKKLDILLREAKLLLGETGDEAGIAKRAVL
ncbi:DUF2508 family protein [Cohnella thailandensis]|uniref:DUF2508 family protein n=1 Tax=Cohnella thailandensis TaxID=557557 RepID=A0A841SSQ8_9BACL|nr:DUF2508 family protein [Cohnella thailandensis]MBB6632950.1 DUF2508 family protein [Cohnella thailandensis]MBP1975357.1 hypothetical protein [Cohnella thailandensis]